MECPNCHTENRVGSNFCSHCNHPLNISVSPDVNVLSDDGRRRRSPTSRKFAQGKDPNLAAILSAIIPGFAIGQFYNGDVLKGIVMLVGASILFWTVIAPLAIWVWSIIDAYKVAKGSQSLWS